MTSRVAQASTWPPPGPVGSHEVEVVAGHVDALRVVGKPEPDHRALDVAELENVLVLHHLAHRRIRLVLAGNRAGSHGIEVTVDAQRVRRGEIAEPGVERLHEPGVVERVGELEMARRLEEGEDGERRPALGLDGVDGAVERGAEERPLEGDHLAVARVERAQPEVAVLPKLAEGDVAVVRAVEQRLDRRGLESRCGSRSACRSCLRRASTWRALTSRSSSITQGVCRATPRA